MKTKINFLTALLLSSTVAFGQAPAIQWENNYGGSNNDNATSVRQTPDGGYIVAGYTNSDNGDVVGHKSGEDFWVLKLTSTGNVTWKKIYGGDNDDRCYAVQPTSDGGYILAGTSNSNNGDIVSAKGGFDAVVMKLDANGNKTFVGNFGGSDDDAFYSIVQTTDGGYIAAGDSKSDNISGTSNKGGYDVLAVKITSTGSKTFEKLYGGSGTDRGYGVDQLSSGQYIIAGETDSNNGDVSGNKGGVDYYVLRIKTNGAINFTRTIGGTDNDQAYGVEALAKNAYAVIGETESNNGDVPDNSGGDDYFVVSVKGDGSFKFAKTYGGETSDIGRSIHKTSDGGFILCGETESNNGDVSNNKGSDDYWVVKIAANGTMKWQKTLGGADKDLGTSAAPTSDGGFIVAGSSESANVDVSDNNGNADYWLVKLNGTQKIGDEVSAVSAIQLYPNPAQSTVTLDGLTEAANVIVYTITGMEAGRFESVSSSLTIDVAQWQAGYYLVRILHADGSQETLKLYKSE